MFHRYALLINGVMLGFCGISYYFSLVPVKQMLNTSDDIPSQHTPNENISSIISSYLNWNVSILLIISQFGIFFYLASVVFVLFSSHFTTVRIGRPPLDSLVIGYKYGYSDSVSTSAIYNSYKLFPSNDKVQICYERKLGAFGLAHGVVIHGQLTDKIKEVLISHGYSVFKTKPISNAVYISSPAIPWLSYFGVWLILTVIYPKLYKYSKTHKLSAYPVLELYRRFSVTLIAPLSQQDVFVVPEAEYWMNRSTKLANLSLDSSVTERSHSTSYHSTRVNGSTIKLTPGHNPVESDKLTKLTPRPSLSPINNGYTAKIILKQSPTPFDNNNVAKSLLVRTSTPVATNGNAVFGEE